MTSDDELRQLRTENATLKHQLEHLDECLAAIDAFADAAAVALGDLIREFDGEPEIQARVSAAVARFADIGVDAAKRAENGLPNPIPN